jgi:hypothetical protein
MFAASQFSTGSLILSSYTSMKIAVLSTAPLSCGKQQRSMQSQAIRYGWTTLKALCMSLPSSNQKTCFWWTRSKHQRYIEARQIFVDIHTKQIDWPEVIWDAWSSFEHLHGSVTDIEICLSKIEKAQYNTNARRTKVWS